MYRRWGFRGMLSELGQPTPGTRQDRPALNPKREAAANTIGWGITSQL